MLKNDINTVIDLKTVMPNKAITLTIREWSLCGYDVCKRTGLPKHPELLYRNSGAWKGWNDFLNVHESSSFFNENRVRDTLEDEAYIIYLGLRD